MTGVCVVSKSNRINFGLEREKGFLYWAQCRFFGLKKMALHER